MNEIENKLIEIWGMLNKMPKDCKGIDKKATENRQRWLEIRRVIQELIEEQ